MYGNAPGPSSSPAVGAVSHLPPTAGAYGYAPPAGPAAAGASGYAPYPAPPAGGYGYGGYDSGYGGGPDPGAGGYGRGPPGGGWHQGPPPPHHHHHGPPGGGGARFAAVRLRGLPYGVREYEVAVFLGLDPVDILMVHRGGRATGEAMAVLAHPAELDIAMRKNKAYMGSRYIEVFEARKMDYYKAVSDTFASRSSGGGPGSPRERSRSPVNRGRGGYGGGGDGHAGGGRGGPPRHQGPVTSKIVKLRGLPFSAGAEEVAEFFNDPSLGLQKVPTASDVTVATSNEGRPNGMAFVEFENTEAAEAALGKDRHLMGSRWIEIFISTEDERARFMPVERS